MGSREQGPQSSVHTHIYSTHFAWNSYITVYSILCTFLLEWVTSLYLLSTRFARTGCTAIGWGEGGAALDKVGRSDELRRNTGNGTRYDEVRRNSCLNSWLQPASS